MTIRTRQTRRLAQLDADLCVYPAFVPITHVARDEASDAAAKVAADAAAAKATADAAAAAGGAGYKPPATQADLDQMIESRLARERAAHRRELDAARGNTSADAAALTELESLRKEKIAREKDELLTELRQTRCNDALLAAASDTGAINARQVARLLESNVKLDDMRKVVVLDDDGNPWLKGGKNIAIADLLEKFAHDNPHLFKAKQAAGAGAGAKGGADTSDAGDSGADDAIAAAQKAYDAAHLQADRSGADADITKARLALRELTRLHAEKKAKKAGAA